MVQHQKSCRSKINNVAILIRGKRFEIDSKRKIGEETIDTFIIKAFQCFVKYKSLEYRIYLYMYMYIYIYKYIYIYMYTYVFYK